MRWADTNPRWLNRKARADVMALVRRRAAAGEPCGICGKPIDLDAPQFYTDPRDGRRKRAPWSLECDEVVPVSRGGSPIDPKNVQPAHRACNQRKGAGKRSAGASTAARGATSRRW